MKYQRFDELPALIEQRLITRRPHLTLPLDVYNYSPSAQFTPISEWTEAMKDCRGLILDRDGEIVGRPFRKFWNYEQVLDQIPSDEGFTVWEKLDGSLGIVCNYNGERVVATRGSFESDQAVWAGNYLKKFPCFMPKRGATYLFEIIYPENRIVVDYGGVEKMALLAVLDEHANDLRGAFEAEDRFVKARRFDGMSDFSTINSDPRFAGQEGFVVRWESGFRAKVKLEEYKRLHRLITQCSTRTIWELLRRGGNTQELLDRVPADFSAWALGQINTLSVAHAYLIQWVDSTMRLAPSTTVRRDFAMWAKEQKHPGLLFLRLDGKPIEDAAWKLVEPKWATPFKGEAE